MAQDRSKGRDRRQVNRRESRTNPAAAAKMGSLAMDNQTKAARTRAMAKLGLIKALRFKRVLAELVPKEASSQSHKRTIRLTARL